MTGILSGGQTGADRAALDVALAWGVPCGGWCPAGRWAEDGPIPAAYPLRETPSADPAQRTDWNAFDADALLLFARGAPRGGSARAREVAERFGRSVLVQDVEDSGAERILRWLDGLPEGTLLNVAGPRESEVPGTYGAVRRVLDDVFGGGARAGAGLAGRTALITGGTGYLGRRVLDLAPPGWEAHGVSRGGGPTDRDHRADLSQGDEVAELFARLRPVLVVHTAYSVTEGERDIWQATANVAAESARHGAHLIHLSSDMVLDGERAPYAEAARPAPVSEYGRWKARAEELLRTEHPGASVVRTSLITSLVPPDPRSARVLAGLRGEERVELFVDELRTPILVDDLARQLWEIARLAPARRAGTWHLAGPEAISRFALGLLVAAAHRLDPAPLLPGRATSRPEPRPRDLRLLTTRADAELPTRARSVSEAVERRG